MLKTVVLPGGVLCGLALLVIGLQQTAGQSGTERSPGGRPLAPSQEPSFGREAEKSRLDREETRLKKEEARLKAVQAGLKKKEAELKKLKDSERKNRTEADRYERQAASLKFRCPNGASFAQCTHTGLKQAFQRRKNDLLSEARLKRNAADRDQRQANVLKTRLDSTRRRLDYDQRVFKQEWQRYQGDRQDWLRRYPTSSGPSGRGFGYDEKAKKTPGK
jgi:hypothetical protein